MNKIIRGSLAAILMVLFLTEMVVMATLSGFASNSDSSHSFIQCESQPVFTLLAEENQGEDFKSHCAQPLARAHVATSYFLTSQGGKIISTRDNQPPVRSLPIYTFFRSLIL